MYAGHYWNHYYNMPNGTNSSQHMAASGVAAAVVVASLLISVCLYAVVRYFCGVIKSRRRNSSAYHSIFTTATSGLTSRRHRHDNPRAGDLEMAPVVFAGSAQTPDFPPTYESLFTATNAASRAPAAGPDVGSCTLVKEQNHTSSSESGAKLPDDNAEPESDLQSVVTDPQPVVTDPQPVAAYPRPESETDNAHGRLQTLRPPEHAQLVNSRRE